MLQSRCTNCERPFTLRTTLGSAPNFVKTCFRRFAIFQFLTSKRICGKYFESKSQFFVNKWTSKKIQNQLQRQIFFQIASFWGLDDQKSWKAVFSRPGCTCLARTNGKFSAKTFLAEKTFSRKFVWPKMFSAQKRNRQRKCLAENSFSKKTVWLFGQFVFQLKKKSAEKLFGRKKISRKLFRLKNFCTNWFPPKKIQPKKFFGWKMFGPIFLCGQKFVSRKCFRNVLPKILSVEIFRRNFVLVENCLVENVCGRKFRWKVISTDHCCRGKCFRPTICLAKRIFGRQFLSLEKFFRTSKTFSAEKHFGQKKFRPKKIFGWKIFWSINFSDCPDGRGPIQKPLRTKIVTLH